MTDKDLKRLGRAELIEMLLRQAEKNEKLRAQIEEAEEQLNDRQLMEEKAGSIAQAAFQMSGVLEAAQDAAAKYLENVKRLSDEGETISRGAEEGARQKAEAMLAQADKYSRETRRKADEYKNETVGRMKAMLQEQDELRALLRTGGEGRAT